MNFKLFSASNKIFYIVWDTRFSQWCCWRLQALFDMMWCLWVGGSWYFKEMWFLHLQGLLGLLDPEDEGTKTLCMSRSYLHSDKASLSWRLDSSSYYLEITVSLYTMEKWTNMVLFFKVDSKKSLKQYSRMLHVPIMQNNSAQKTIKSINM